MTDWPATVIWWHVYPLGFVGAEPHLSDCAPGQVHHRLDHLVGWLDYVVELGCNGLFLGPIFASTSHGYDTLDHNRIDPRLGDDADFAALINEAKTRGIRLLLDGVFNHVSRDHEIAQRALAGGPDSEAGRWVRWVDGYVRVFEGNADLVELDLDHPPVADDVVNVMTHWLGRGVDGWRLDAAYSAGAAPWKPIVERVRAAYPDCWVLGEVIQDDYVAFVRESGVDSVTQYELWKATWSSLNDANLHELAWSLKRHSEFQEHFRPQTFIGNHDVTRIATKLADPRHMGHAVALLLLVPGIPSIYAGDEQGFTGEKLDQPRGDDSVRPPFPETPEGLLPFGAKILELYRRVIGLRRRNPWLVDATVTTRRVTNEAIVLDLHGDGQRLTLALNVADKPLKVGGKRIRPHDWAAW
ncbi:MAG: alpha-amylase family glycosyl hydrolase [Dermatophilaceae bacterium]